MQKDFSSTGEFVQYPESQSRQLRGRQACRSRSRTRSRPRARSRSTRSRSNVRKSGPPASTRFRVETSVRSRSNTRDHQQNSSVLSNFYHGLKTRFGNYCQYFSQGRQKYEVGNRGVAEAVEKSSVRLSLSSHDGFGYFESSNSSPPRSPSNKRRPRNPRGKTSSRMTSSLRLPDQTGPDSGNYLLRIAKTCFQYIVHERNALEVRNREVSFDDSRAWRLHQPDIDDVNLFASPWAKAQSAALSPRTTCRKRRGSRSTDSAR